jgi:microcystin-dependent protein
MRHLLLTLSLFATAAFGQQPSREQLTPPGTLIAFAGATCPTGWLLANGAAVSRTTYAKLFTAISTAWGYGDNSTTFNLPDLRGRFLRGKDGGVARDPDRATRTACNTGGATGDAVGSCQGDVMQGHKHGLEVKNDSNTAGNVSASANASTANNTINTIAAPTTDGVNGTPRTSSETRPVNVNVNYCVKS